MRSHIGAGVLLGLAVTVVAEPCGVANMPGTKLWWVTLTVEKDNPVSSPRFGPIPALVPNVVLSLVKRRACCVPIYPTVKSHLHPLTSTCIHARKCVFTSL